MLPKLEGALDGFDCALDGAPVGGPADRNGRWVLTAFPTDHYKNPDKWRTGSFATFADGLAALGETAREQGDDNVRGGKNLPVVDADLRLAVHADREPEERG
jgi:hypothetical protein